MTRNSICCLLILVLTGCGGVERLAGGRYVLKVPYANSTRYDEMVAELSRQSEKQCKDGYRKLNDYDTFEGGERVLVWEIHCRGGRLLDDIRKLDRPEQSGGF